MTAAVKKAGIAGLAKTAEAVSPATRLLLVALCLTIIYLLFDIIDKRENLRQLAKQRYATEDAINDLKDEQRALELEYLTLTRYDNIAERAATLQMVMPQMADGNLLYLTGQTLDVSAASATQGDKP